MKKTMESLESGAQVIKDYLKVIPETPGVYRMMNDQDEVLYVGKAKALRKRVANYTVPNRLSIRIQRMVAETAKMEFVTTETEASALLLEASLIKKLQPRYNVLLKDAKSFPYILLTKDHDFPRITKHRGAQKTKGIYYGPFPSAGAVNKTLKTLYKAFQIRNCTDNMFASRKRPCLQYHIKQCTAPCVDYVSKNEYAQQVRDACGFMEGKTDTIKKNLAEKMQAASEALEFEQAAAIRDRINALSVIQAQNEIYAPSLPNGDVIGAVAKGGKVCVQVFFFRAGQNLGNKPFFLKQEEDHSVEDILESFLPQLYEVKPVPKAILLSHDLGETDVLTEALSAQSGQALSIAKPQRGDKKRLIDWVVKNASEALDRHMAESATQKAILEKLAETFDLDEPPQRIEVYDNSHISGTNMVGALIVAGPEGFRKNAYRKFNIREADASDDFGMMREVIKRRFSNMLEEGVSAGHENWPDLVLIDGGKGQLSAVREVLEELELWDQLNVVAISKGPDRNAGREEFHIEGRAPFKMPKNDAVLFYLQRLRDEAHRFAITSHRARRAKDIVKSPLDELQGVGAKRKKALLLYFGSAKAVGGASVVDLQKVEGISKGLAEKIYAHFH